MKESMRKQVDFFLNLDKRQTKFETDHKERQTNHGHRLNHLEDQAARHQKQNTRDSERLTVVEQAGERLNKDLGATKKQTSTHEKTLSKQEQRLKTMEYRVVSLETRAELGDPYPKTRHLRFLPKQETVAEQEDHKPTTQQITPSTQSVKPQNASKTGWLKYLAAAGTGAVASKWLNDIMSFRPLTEDTFLHHSAWLLNRAFDDSDNSDFELSARVYRKLVNGLVKRGHLVPLNPAACKDQACHQAQLERSHASVMQLLNELDVQSPLAEENRYLANSLVIMMLVEMFETPESGKLQLSQARRSAWSMRNYRYIGRYQGSKESLIHDISALIHQNATDTITATSYLEWLNGL